MFYCQKFLAASVKKRSTIKYSEKFLIFVIIEIIKYNLIITLKFASSIKQNKVIF